MKRLLWLIGLVCVCAVSAHGQTQIAGFATDPATCNNTRGLLIYNTTTLTMKSCGPTVNTWTALGGGGGGTISGTIALNQIAVGSAANTIAGSNNFTWTSGLLYNGLPVASFGATMQSVLTNNPGGSNLFPIQNITSPLEANAVIATEESDLTNGQITNFFGFLDIVGSGHLTNQQRDNGTFTTYYESSGNIDAPVLMRNLNGSFQFASPATISGQVNAGTFQTYSVGASGGTIAKAVGVESQLAVTTGYTFTNMYFFKASPWTHTGSATNMYDYYAGTTAGFGTNNYGLYVEDFGSNANDYAIYAVGGKSHMGGPVDTTGPVTVTSDGVHNGIVSLTCNTTDATLPANTVSILGCPAASNTAWGIRLPTAEPAALSVPTLATASSHYSQMSNSPTTGTLGSVVLSVSPTLVTPTLGVATATSLATGTSPPTCAAGTAGAYCANEGTAVTGASAVDDIYGDSTNHCMTVINQLANMGCIVGSLRATMIADWTCGTAGTVSSCVAATIIGSGGGTPLTLTLPLAAISYDWDCDLVVGQATAATANNWNMLTATNGATNVTVSYTQGDSATTFGGGATTDQAATTTTFNIGGAWTLGGTATKMPVHIHGRIEGASASGTVVSLQLVAPTVGDLVTIYRGASCWAHQ